MKNVDKKYKKNIFVDFLINVHPYHLSVTILPDDIKEQAIQMLEDYKNTEMSVNVHPMTLNSLNGIIGLLKKQRPKDWQDQINNLKIHTKSLDNARLQDINLVDARLAELINE